MAKRVSNGTMSLLEFVTKAIAHKQATTKYKGIHVIYDGLNAAITRHYNGSIEPRPELQKLVDSGKLHLRGARGGPMLYLPKDAPQMRDKAAELLRAITGK